MSIVLLVMTDGRPTVHEAIASATRHLHGPITHRVIHDDSGNASHRGELSARYPDFEVIGGPRAGFGGAIAHAWEHLVNSTHESWVFHLEDDFTFNSAVDLAGMATVMDANPHLLQMALRRQPWNEAERRAGGIVEQHPDDFVERHDESRSWLEHRRFFTTNPSLYRSELCSVGWPSGEQSEGKFGIQLMQNQTAAFAFWGSRASGEWVTHIGHERVGYGY